MTIQEAIKVLENVISFDYTEETEAIGVVLKALAELKESKKEGKWKPKEEEEYWSRTDYGEVGSARWIDDEIDNWRYNNIPIFPTKEECERYWHFMDTVKEKSYEFSKEEIQDSSIYKLSIGYVPSNNRFYISYDADCKYFGEIYFKTEEDAQYIIDNFKDELMEYWI